MAIYLAHQVHRTAAMNEIGMDMRLASGPDIFGSWPGDYLYYWACQVSFHDPSGTATGGGHFGLQAFHSADLPPGATKTVINWGVYDDTIGGFAVFRNSQVLEPEFFSDINSDVSFGFPWRYGRWYRFRVFKSPKQDWVANEIRPGNLQVAPYVGTDQQSDEIAFRCTVQDLTSGTPPILFHDVLVKGASGNRPMGDGLCFTEVVAGAGYPGGMDAAEVEWPDNPECHWRHSDCEGPTTVSQWVFTYKASTANCNTDAVNASGGEPGYFRMKGPTTRTNADGTLSAPPTGFWDAPPAVNTSAPASFVTPAPQRPYY